ncbi:VWA domain-containing protein [Endozoicomonas lisbonensis]|uniref:Ca-activated chloride channel family protein n=1 Tax=Endozoicomonas lisbonensis TaxID=3120522 RepID=A0ABV2SJA1_9GAMM
MNQLTLLAPQWLWLLALIPAWCFLAVYQQQKSRSDLKQFSKHLSLPAVSRRSATMLVTIALLSVSMSRPAWNPQPKGLQDQGRDIIFLLDVSRSMLADDARPNRMEVARTAIRQVVNTSSNDRIGLAAFAGETSIQSPVTRDRVFLNTLLDNIGPGTVATGGTRIGDALMTVLEKMLDSGNSGNPEAADIVLITDGEDLGENPEEAIALMNQLGTRLLIIGLGDTQFGARVPTRDGKDWAMDEGREHWSRLDGTRLRSLAQQADQGIYFPVGTAWLDLPGILDQLRVLWPADSREQGEVLEYTEGYPYLMALAALLLVLSLMQWPVRVSTSAVLPCLLLLAVSASHAQDPVDLHELEQRASDLIEQKLYADAASLYRQVADLADDQPTAVAASYNLATSLIHLANSSYDDFLSPVDFIEEAFFEEAMQSDEYVDPEIYLSEARKVLRDILLTDPEHEPSKRNLEWLALEQYRLHQDIDTVQQQEQQQGDQEEESETEANSESEEGEESLEQEGDESTDSDVDESDSAEFDDMDTMFGDLLEPTPSANAKQILDQARQLEGELQQLDQQRQNTVDRDW